MHYIHIRVKQKVNGMNIIFDTPPAMTDNRANQSRGRNWFCVREAGEGRLNLPALPTNEKARAKRAGKSGFDDGSRQQATS